MYPNSFLTFCLTALTLTSAIASGELPLIDVRDRPLPVALISILSSDRKEIADGTGIRDQFSVVGFQKIEAFPLGKASGWFLVVRVLHEEGTLLGFAINERGNVLSPAIEVTNESCLIRVDDGNLGKLEVGRHSYVQHQPASDYLQLTLFNTALGPLELEPIIFTCGTIKRISRDTDDYTADYQVVYLSDFAHSGSMQIMVHSFDFSNKRVKEDWFYYKYDSTHLEYNIMNLPLKLSKSYQQMCEQGKSALRIELLPPDSLAPELGKYRTPF